MGNTDVLIISSRQVESTKIKIENGEIPKDQIIIVQSPCGKLFNRVKASRLKYKLKPENTYTSLKLAIHEKY